MDQWLLTALLLGLFGSAHCVGMCGPLVLAVPSPGKAFLGRFGGIVVMNMGRTLTYLMMGAGFGMFGRGLQMAGLQQAVSIALGLIILAGLVAPKLLPTAFLARIPGTLVVKAQRILGQQIRRRSWEGIFFSGLLNGLLPCGLVYLALAGALAQDGYLQGALFMAFFGLGTWPALVIVKLSGDLLGARSRRSLRRLAPYAYAFMAIMLILRGFDLGVPFVSPDLPGPNSALDSCSTNNQ